MDTKFMNNATISGETKLVSTDSLARRYEVSARQIQLWTTNGLLPVVKLGRRCVRYPVAECDAALAKFQTRAVCLTRKGGQD
jgi:hypothetical protein